MPATNAATSGTAGPSTLGLKARTGPRSGARAGSRLQGASRAGSHGGAAASDGPIKQNHSKEQAEKKNHAIVQLRKLLVQGNRRVEALATVIQHLFTEVLLHLHSSGAPCWSGYTSANTHASVMKQFIPVQRSRGGVVLTDQTVCV